MTQVFNITVNHKKIYFRSPTKFTLPVVFPPCRDILIAYMKKYSKNRYEVVVAYKNSYSVYSNCKSIKKACQVLQTAYNG